MRFVATCAAGLEALLADELQSLGAREVEPELGAVHCHGDWSFCWKANLWLRTANRLLIEIGRFELTEESELYPAVRRVLEQGDGLDGVSIDDLLDPDRTLSVRATASRSRFRDNRWLALKVKDAVVDRQRELTSRRSNVDRRRPDLPFRLWVQGRNASLLLDTSGAPLDRRGYRKRSSRATVREQIAAACVLASGWQGPGAIVDPMCGSGTLLIEAGWIALGWAPSRLRSEWSFQRWPGFEPTTFATLQAEPSNEPSRLFGNDQSAEAVAACRENLEVAGLSDFATIRRGTALSARPPQAPGGLVLVNPGYGRQLPGDADSFKRLGDTLKQNYSGWTAVVLAGDEGKGKWLGLRPRRKIPIKHGPIDARILVVDLW